MPVGTEAPGAVASAPQAPSDAHGAGLVHFSTTDTIRLDHAVMRAKRTRHATITGARLIQEQLTRGGRRTYPVMITLTYGAAWLCSNGHITTYLKRCRELFRRRGKRFHYCWVAELQQRGVVHYHVVVWMPKGLQLPKPDKAGWWRYGMTRIEAARNAVGYLAKYVSKDTLKQQFPKGLRVHGRGGLSRASRIEQRWWASPLWVRRWTGEIVDVRRAKSGGFVRLDTGEYRPSPFEVVRIDGYFCAVPRSSVPVRNY